MLDCPISSLCKCCRGMGKKEGSVCNALSLLPLPPHALSLLQHGISPQLKFLLGSCTCVGSPWATASSRACPTAPEWGSPWAAGWICLTMACTTSCRTISALVPGAPPAPPSLALGLAGLWLLLPATAVPQCIRLGGLLSQLCPT